MKVRCTHKCVFRGDTVKVGAVFDIDAAEAKDAIVASSFVKVDPAEVEPSPTKVIVAGLTRDQAIAKLGERKVRVPAKISDEKLAERYNETFGVDAK